MKRMLVVAAMAGWLGCGGDDDGGPGQLGDGGIVPPRPVCSAGGGGSSVAEPVESLTLDEGGEGWLASVGVADLDGDGTAEIVAGRGASVVTWSGGQLAWMNQTEGRVWASPVIADLLPDSPGLEVAAASRATLYAWDADGEPLAGYPVSWRDELRTLATGDVDGDGALELVVVTTRPEESSGQRDIVMAFEADGDPVAGFPPNTSGASGCDDACYVTGGYDQNLALGDVDGDGIADIFATQDNAYLSLHDGTGRAFDAAAIFAGKSKFMGIRFLHDYALAQQGYADDEESANQAHFTNSAPAIADVDGDGTGELVVLASVQNAAQSDRERGVALWVVESDGTRPDGWAEPFHAGDYLAGLWDFEGTNVVAATNQVAAVDLDPDRAGPEMVFAGFDGRIHAVAADRSAMWSFPYTSSDRVLTAGVAIADLSADGVPEVVFATYSPDDGVSALFVLDGGGNLVHEVALPGRGAMSVPTIADADGDGELDIVLSLKDGSESGGVRIYSVEGAGTECLLWPTGRGSPRRDGYLPAL